MEPGEYEYSREYETLEEARQEIIGYYREDKTLGEIHGYTILDDDFRDAEEAERELFWEYSMDALRGIGIENEEAEMLLEDFGV